MMRSRKSLTWENWPASLGSGGIMRDGSVPMIAEKKT